VNEAKNPEIDPPPAFTLYISFSINLFESRKYFDVVNRNETTRKANENTLLVANMKVQINSQRFFT